MSNPVNPSIEKVRQSFLALSLKPSSSLFPITYADGVWDVATEGSTLAALLDNTGQFDQHTVNEALAYAIVSITQTLELIWRQINPDVTPGEHNDFTDDFTDDFN